MDVPFFKARFDILFEYVFVVSSVIGVDDTAIAIVKRIQIEILGRAKLGMGSGRTAFEW